MGEKTKVYCMPGMSAKPSIFERIHLPEEQFEIHWLSWLPPHAQENIVDYAKRMCALVKHENIILVGVSFGGLVVQEMGKLLKCNKIIIISSLKTKHELPKFMKFGRKSKLYKVLPTFLAKHYEKLKSLPIGRKVKKRIKLYERHIDLIDANYLDWAIDQVLNWNQETPMEGIIHIHGDRDRLFPLKYISDCYVVKGGTHIMIITRYRWFNRNLPLLLAYKGW